MTPYLTALRDLFFQQRDRWAFWLPVPMAFGIAAYFCLLAEPPLFLGAVLFLLALAFVFIVSRINIVWFLCLAAALAAAGFAAAQWRTHDLKAPVLTRESYPVTLHGRVAEVDPQPRGLRIVLEDFHMLTGTLWEEALPERIRLRLKARDTAAPGAGDIVSVKAVLMPPSPPVMPDAFDFQWHAYFQGMGATGYAVGNVTVHETAARGFFFERLRHAIRLKIEAAIDDRDNAAIMTAFIVGESRGISEEDWKVARDSGIAHLIAISGSHFVLIAGFPFFMVRAFLAAIPWVALRWPIKKIAAAVAIAVSVFYMLLIGAPITAQRAVIMTSVVMVAIMLDRNPFSLRLAAFAALVIFALEPESLAGPSFQMSFAAVVALISFYEATEKWWRTQLRDAPWPKRWSLYLLACFLTTLVANVATAPYALYHFGHSPLVAGLMANMIAVPVSSFITFPVGLVSCLMMPFGLEKGALMLADKSLAFIMVVAEDAAAWSSGGLRTNAWPVSALAALTLGGLWFCCWRGWLRLGGFAFIAVAALIAFTAPRPDVLVSHTGELLAVRADDGRLLFNTLRRERFVREKWTEREGRLGTGVWPQAGEGPLSGLSCEADSACAFHKAGHHIAFVTTREQARSACEAGADVIVSAIALDSRNTCPRLQEVGRVIDRQKLRREMSHALYLTPEALKIVSDRDRRGQRPWTGGERRYVKKPLRPDAAGTAIQTKAFGPQPASDALDRNELGVATERED